jgi:hypothetical protein
MTIAGTTPASSPTSAGPGRLKPAGPKADMPNLFQHPRLSRPAACRSWFGRISSIAGRLSLREDAKRQEWRAAAVAPLLLLVPVMRRAHRRDWTVSDRMPVVRVQVPGVSLRRRTARSSESRGDPATVGEMKMSRKLLLGKIRVLAASLVLAGGAISEHDGLGLLPGPLELLSAGRAGMHHRMAGLGLQVLRGLLQPRTMQLLHAILSLRLDGLLRPRQAQARLSRPRKPSNRSEQDSKFGLRAIFNSRLDGFGPIAGLSGPGSEYRFTVKPGWRPPGRSHPPGRVVGDARRRWRDSIARSSHSPNSNPPAGICAVLVLSAQHRIITTAVSVIKNRRNGWNAMLFGCAWAYSC